MSAVHLQKVPPSPAILAQYVKIAEAHEYPKPMGSKDGFLLVADQEGQLVAAVTMFDAGNFIVFEDFVLNPDFPSRVRHAAAQQVAVLIQSTCANLGKAPYCPVQSKGAAMILRKFGFEGRPVLVMTKPPSGVYLDTVEDKKVSRPRKEPPKQAPSAGDKGDRAPSAPKVARKRRQRKTPVARPR